MNNKIELFHQINIEYLLSKNFKEWDIVGHIFEENYLNFENILFKIHFKRNKKLKKYQKDNIINFLFQGYMISKDIRYFNEFLWFYNNEKRYLEQYIELLEYFKQNTINKTHPFTLCTIEDIKKFLNENNCLITKNTEVPERSFKIGLIGPPFFFKNVYWKLSGIGLNLESISLTSDSDIKKKFFLNSGIFFRLFNLFKGVSFPYQIINSECKDEQFIKKLQDRNFDIGFHKLGFIIKENILNCFNIGIINDHWGILPFIRGKSTIEYSLLFGFPIGATTHFINTGIDTGEIIKIYLYNDILKECKSIKQIKFKIKQNLENRIFDSINSLCEGNQTIENNTLNGLTFYSMHNFLLKYIKKEILK